MLTTMSCAPRRQPPRAASAALVAVASLIVATGCRRAQPPAPPGRAPTAHPREVPVKTDENAHAAAPGRALTWTTPPGSTPLDAATRAKLDAAWAKLPAGHRPRTRHHDRPAEAAEPAEHADPYAPAGAIPTYTNRLLLAASPYLRQHAHNPVDWRPWGPEAFDEARRLGRPIFLSIGYATCHWCHVMEHESFEDLEIAEVLNSRYVPIKVDREERPDVDAVYMAAVQAMTGHGGWPMSVWLDPGPAGADGQNAGLRGKPFFAGTYFPARTGDRGRHMGFLTLLGRLGDAWATDRARVAEQADAVVERIKAQLEAAAPGPLPDLTTVDRAARMATADLDPVHGGPNRAPKFPSHMPNRLLLRHHLRTGDAQSRHAALLTLEKMVMGGIYDQVGGGLARYSTDARWLVPHFEKMLYDQALFVWDLLDAYLASRQPRFAEAARDVLDYALRELRHARGGFFSATDADSEGEEGRFFVWTPAGLEAVLGPEDARLFAAIFDVTDAGNFEGRNILHRAERWDALARRHGIDEATLRARWKAARAKLYAARAERVPPLRDDKVIVAWNGLMISALARAAVALDEPTYASEAAKTAGFVLGELRDEAGRLTRSWLDGASADDAAPMGVLEDHAFLIAGLLDLLTADGDPRWLREAIELQRVQDEHFADTERGGYYAAADDAPTLLAREKPDYDGAEPSGNSVAAMNLVRLAALTGDAVWDQRADRALRALGSRAARAPMALTELLVAVEAFHAPLLEIVLVAPSGTDAAAATSAFKPFLDALRGGFYPHHVMLRAVQGPPLDALAEVAPIVAGKVARGGQVTAYVCRKGVCQLPVTDAEAMVEQLGRTGR